MAVIKQVGWSYRISKDKAIVYPPAGGLVVMSLKSGGDFRAARNALAQLRRAGLFDARQAQQGVRRGAADTQKRCQLHASEQQFQSTIPGSGPGEGDSVMAKSEKQLLELVERCERVGWAVRKIGVTGAHILIHPPEKRPVTIATSSKVNNYPTQILTKLTRAGLLEAESKMNFDHEADRLQRLHDDRERNERLMPAVQDEDATEQAAPEPADEAEPEPEVQRRGDVPGGVSEVRGVAVAEWDFARTPIGATDKKTIELLLEDGTLHYSCLLGDFIGATWQAVSKHRKGAHPELRSAAAQARDAAAAKAAEAAALAEAVVNSTPTVKAVAAGAKKTTAASKPAALPARSTPAPQQGVAGKADAAVVRLVERHPQPVLFSAAEPAPPATPATPALPAPQRIEPMPPAARVGLSSVAAVRRTPSKPVEAPAAGLDLPGMLQRMRELAAADAERATLARQLAEARLQNERLQAHIADLDKRLRTYTEQGARLADECIAKDNTIRRLREKIEADAVTVSAAAELQKLMATLMGGGGQVTAAA